jgi:hypothetical protein
VVGNNAGDGMEHVDIRLPRSLNFSPCDITRSVNMIFFEKKGKRKTRKE